MSTPTAPLPPAAVEVSRAAARYKVAADLTARVALVMDTRDLTDIEMTDLLYVQDVMREARAVLAAAGRLDLLGGAS
jgi:hypothetical protein